MSYLKPFIVPHAIINEAAWLTWKFQITLLLQTAAPQPTAVLTSGLHMPLLMPYSTGRQSAPKKSQFSHSCLSLGDAGSEHTHCKMGSLPATHIKDPEASGSFNPSLPTTSPPKSRTMKEANRSRKKKKNTSLLAVHFLLTFPHHSSFLCPYPSPSHINCSLIGLTFVIVHFLGTTREQKM